MNTKEVIKINGQILIINELPTNIQHQIELHNFIIEQLTNAKKHMNMCEIAHQGSSARIVDLYNTHLSEATAHESTNPN